jgi:hypothetical protein
MSSNLSLTQMAEAQASPEVTHNDALSELDAALTEDLAVDVTAGNATVTAAQFRRNVKFTVTGASVARTVTLQAIKRLFLVDVPSTNTANVGFIVGATTVTLVPGSKSLMYTDGSANGLAQLSHATTGAFTLPFDLHVYFPGLPTASAIILYTSALRTFTLPANLSGSIVKSLTAATASTVIDIQKNGVSFGSITFALGATDATFSTTATSFAVDDELKLVAPASPDATLAGIAIDLYGTRTG